MALLPNPVGVSLRVFLADGGSDGIWVAEKSNWTGLALKAPRSRYGDLRKRPELMRPGVYVLVGANEASWPPDRIYIGESDELRTRLDGHHKSLDFWDRVIVFTSKDENLNKAGIRHLESRLIQIATSAKTSVVDNKNAGTPPKLSEADTAEAEAFLADMLLLYPVLGLRAFEQPQEAQPTGIRLYARAKDAIGEGEESGDGFIVYKGSLARAGSVPSAHAYVNDIRSSLTAQGVLVPEGPHLRFSEDYVFTSPSQAAMVLFGRTANGRIEWKTIGGATLKALQMQSVSDQPIGAEVA